MEIMFQNYENYFEIIKIIENWYSYDAGFQIE